MSFRDVYTFYVEPDDFDEEELDDEEIELAKDDFEYQARLAEAETKEGTAECVHLYMMPNYENKWHCYACGWTEGGVNVDSDR